MEAHFMTGDKEDEDVTAASVSYVLQEVNTY